jgi:hypothetical protein
MALGYQGLIIVDNHQYLVTDGNIDHVRPEIVSEGVYSPENISEATNRVHTFDLDEVTGGFNMDVNEDLIDFLFDSSSGWILKRDEAKDFLWYSNAESKYEFGDSFWTRASLSTGPGSMLVASMDIVLIPATTEEPDYELPLRKLNIDDDYIEQKFGFKTSDSFNRNGFTTDTGPIHFGFPDKYQPIPYWKTILNLDLPEGVYVLNWSLEMTNNISRRSLCSASSGTEDHPGPTLIQVGLASVVLNVSFVSVFTPNFGEYFIPERFDSATISIGDKTLSLGRLDSSINGEIESTALQQTSDATNITGAGSLTEMTYIASGYFTLPHLV